MVNTMLSYMSKHRGMLIYSDRHRQAGVCRYIMDEGAEAMPTGRPNKNTVRVERYQKKVGYKTKSFKLKGDVAERFADACEKNGESQAAVIARLMEEYILTTCSRCL